MPAMGSRERKTGPLRHRDLRASRAASPEESSPSLKKYFSRYFRNATGQTFTAYLNTIRMNHACQLLLETDDTVLEIALECGYENVSYFIRLFGNLMHCTPLQYRLSKQHRLKQQF